MRLLLICGVYVITLITGVSATTTSITQWGITWTFDPAVEYGTFVNGDYWVVAPVTVTDMSPAWTGTDNGWEVNPLIQIPQGFYAGAYPAGTVYDASLRPEMPFTITTNASLIKVIGSGDNIPVVKTAAVLTILTATPTNNGADVFRPPYVGTNKPLYQVSSLRTNLLPSKYAPTANTPTLASVVTEYSKCLRMDHHASVPRWFRPSDALSDYQPDNTVELNDAMLRFMLNDSQADKLQALILFTQHSIDRAYAITNGYRRLDDGHNPNHRILGVWAAVMLDMTDVKAYLATADGFHEDAFLLSSPNTTKVIWGQSGYSEYAYWNYIMTGSGSKSLQDPYRYIDGGKLSSQGASYQNIVSQSFKGQALCYKLFPELQAYVPVTQLTNVMNYAERWVNVGVWALPDPVAPYDGTNANYGVTFGTNGVGGYIAGSGRWPQYHGANTDGGQNKSDFVASMWDAYWIQHKAKVGTIRTGSLRGK